MSDVDRTDSTSWTLGTLRRHLEGQIQAVKEAAASAQTAQERAVAAALAAQEKAVAAAMAAASLATNKAEAANDKRAELMNEFRGALTDQNKTFALKSELYSRLDAGDRRLEDLKTALEKRIDIAESNQERGAGKSQGIALVLASAATLVSLGSALYAVFKH